jgi:hypothetical protein
MAKIKNIVRKAEVEDVAWANHQLKGYWIAETPGRILAGLFVIFLLILATL